MVVAETTVTELAGTPSNVTPLAPVKSEPVSVTEVPPPTGPLEGEIDVSTGTS